MLWTAFDSFKKNDAKDYLQLTNNLLCAEIAKQRPDLQEKGISVKAEISPQLMKKINESNYEQRSLAFFVTALSKPYSLDGKFEVVVGEETIYLAEDRKLLCDPLNLVAEFNPEKIEQKITEHIKDVVDSEKLHNQIDSLVQKLELQPDTNGVYLKSKDYIFAQKDENVVVKSTANNREIFNKDGFTLQATMEDLLNLPILVGETSRHLKPEPLIKFKL